MPQIKLLKLKTFTSEFRWTNFRHSKYRQMVQTMRLHSKGGWSSWMWFWTSKNWNNMQMGVCSCLCRQRSGVNCRSASLKAWLESAVIKRRSWKAFVFLIAEACSRMWFATSFWPLNTQKLPTRLRETISWSYSRSSCNLLTKPNWECFSIWWITSMPLISWSTLILQSSSISFSDFLMRSPSYERYGIPLHSMQLSLKS